MSLAAAYRAEAFKLARNRTTVIVGFWLVPAALFLIGLALEALAPELPNISAYPVRQWAAGFAAAGNPLIQLFYAIAAASLFAGEYRFETWRLMTPRNDRTGLLLGKFGVYLTYAALSLVAIGLVNLLLSLYGPLVDGLPTVWPEAPSSAALQVAAAYAAGLLELAVMGAMVAAGTVVTRSTLGGVVPALLFAFAELLLSTYQDPPLRLDPSLLLPRFASEVLSRLGDDSVPVTPALAAAAAGALVFWTAILLAVGVIAFRGQDLAKE